MNITNNKKCCNCGACMNICPVDAISIDAKGLFYSMHVDTSLCIDCGACVEACPLASSDHPIYTPTEAYAAINKDHEAVMNSSSGGVFTAIAKMVIARGGIVVSAKYSSDYSVVEFSDSDHSELEAFSKSKYVESLVNYSFRSIKKELETGRLVFACATPCQIAGLKKYLRKTYDNLITCDFACGGLPSHILYNEYILYLSHRFNSNIKRVDFRPKIYGWKEHALKVEFINGKSYIKAARLDPFFSAFVNKHYNIRSYCCECIFVKNHFSDLTIADFWESSEYPRIPDDNSGISLVLVNSRKGQNTINQLSGVLNLYDLDVEKASYNNIEHSYDTSFQNRRSEYLSCCKNYGVVSAGKKYCTTKGLRKIKTILRCKKYAKELQLRNTTLL